MGLILINKRMSQSLRLTMHIGPVGESLTGSDAAGRTYLRFT